MAYSILSQQASLLERSCTAALISCQNPSCSASARIALSRRPSNGITLKAHSLNKSYLQVKCSATETAEVASENWIPVIPVEALPRGERRLVRQDGETILLLWYRNEIYAIENTSPAEGAYAEGFINAKLTQDGCIVCPSTDSTYELKTGKVKEWYPKNVVLKALTKSLRDMKVYPVKIENYQICVNFLGGVSDNSAELVFGGDITVGQTATDVAVDEVRMFVDELEGGFGFSPKNELVNGRAAMVGFVMLLIIELVTGKGFIATTGFLNFLYSTVLKGYPIIN